MAEKQEIFALRDEGYTYRDIAKKVGVSFQRVAQVCAGVNSMKGYPVRLNEHVKYDKIRDWMYDNKVNITKMTQLMGYENCTATKQRVSAMLYGEKEMRMRDIKKLLNLTGFTFEEVFGEEEQ